MVRSQTAIFSKLVKDVMRRGPLTVTVGTTCADVTRALEANAASSATVTDVQGRPVGIITEQDIARRVAFKVSPETPVETVMTTPVRTTAAGEYLYRAIALMRRRELHHMPVVDGDGTVVGMLDLAYALGVAAQRMMGQIDRLTHEGTLEGLREVKKAQVELAEELFADNIPAPEIQSLLTHINNDIYRRVVDACVSAMATAGWGEPPVAFSTIVMGSGGRGENYLFPDQDNGYVLDDYPDADHNHVDRYFIELAERMTHDLDAVGFPYCNGYCMAVNPLWRKTLPQWIEQINLWGRKRNVVAIRLSDIFFDFQPACGEDRLAAGLRSAVTEMVQRNHFFLEQMFQEEADHNVALGLFGRFITEKDKEEYVGQMNLKHTGTLPLVEAVRLLALREGVTETATLARIEALHGLGVLDGNTRESLSSAFHLITDVLLKKQIKDFKAGNKVSYYVDPETLSKHARSRLVDALRAIDHLRQQVRTDFTGSVF